MNTFREAHRIKVSQGDLDDLRRRLDSTRWLAPPEEAPNQVGGTQQGWLREICESWCDGYDWRRAEARLNEYEQGLAQVQGEGMHYLRAHSKHPDAQSIVITHAWGGSIIEHLDLVDRIVDPPAFGSPADDGFHVVVPSMPGFGFSGTKRQPGFTVHRVADPIADLMQAIGYPRYVA